MGQEQIGSFIFALVVLFGTISTISGQSTSTTCGGSLEGLSGSINYKLGAELDVEEQCVWTIVAPKKLSLRVQLSQDGFKSSYYQNIQIYGIVGTGLQLVQSINQGDRQTYTIAGGSLIQISFTSSSISPGQGFSLKFEGIGPDDTSKPATSSDTSFNASQIISYVVIEQQQNGAQSGAVSYPGNLVPKRSEFVSFTLNVPVRKVIQLTVNFTTNIRKLHGCSEDVNTLVVTEIVPRAETPFSTRFRECGFWHKSSAHTTTIYSYLPLVVSYLTSKNWSLSPDTEKFELTWKLVDDY